MSPDRNVISRSDIKRHADYGPMITLVSRIVPHAWSIFTGSGWDGDGSGGGDDGNDPEYTNIVFFHRVVGGPEVKFVERKERTHHGSRIV